MSNDKEVETTEDDNNEIAENELTDDAEHHIAGIEYFDEPDAENIMPAEDQPGTL